MADKPRPFSRASSGPSWLRIIGGQLRGQRIRYSGDPQVRPMKDRVREALFNLLGDTVVGKHAIDLFAGTGVLGLEALSRGATAATLVERHAPTARMIRENVDRLKLGGRVDVLVGDAFLWARQPNRWPLQDWLLFCCPPYRYYEEHSVEMDSLLNRLLTQAPPGSACVVEATADFDIGRLPLPEAWVVRCYPPAMLVLLYDTTALARSQPSGEDHDTSAGTLPAAE